MVTLKHEIELPLFGEAFLFPFGTETHSLPEVILNPVIGTSRGGYTGFTGISIRK